MAQLRPSTRRVVLDQSIGQDGQFAPDDDFHIKPVMN